jgi:hypothetical protein
MMNFYNAIYMLMKGQGFASLLTWAVKSSFADGELFKDMDEDLINSDEGLSWKVRKCGFQIYKWC